MGKIEEHCTLMNLTPLFSKSLLEDNLIKDLDKQQFKCNKCESINEVSILNGYLPVCNRCSGYKGRSLIEEEITAFINDNYDKDIQLNNRTLLQGRTEIDIYLPDINLAIEVNGLYWHSEIWGKYKEYHLNKTNICLDQGIHLIHVFDHEWKDKKEIVQSMLLNKLNKTPNKIYARKCEIKEIPYNITKEFLNDNHIQGECISATNIGLYYNNELVSVMTFGINRFSKDKDIEMLRFCNKLNINVIGGASKLFKYYVNKYNPSSITTFADRRYSLGKLYNTLKFEFQYFTTPNYFYWKNMVTYNRISFQKHKLKNKLPIFDEKQSEYDNMLANGYNRVWDCGNYKFIWKAEK